MDNIFSGNRRTWYPAYVSIRAVSNFRRLRLQITSNRQHGYVPLADGASLPDGEEHTSTSGINAETATFGHICSTPYGGKLTIHPGGEGYTYAYGPQGLRGLLHNSYALKCAVFASIGGLTFGYDQGVIANILVMKDFTEKWRIGPWEEGLMSECSRQRYRCRPIF